MKYIFSLLMTLWCVSVWAQDGGYNPSNPQEPSQMYNLTVSASPNGAGSAYPSGTAQYVVGSSVTLSAYASTNYRFVAWKKDTTVISLQPSFSYTIPASNIQLKAVFEYQPGNPADPSQPVLQHKLNLTASPTQGGQFNISSGTSFSEGSTVGLQAYVNSGYEFIGWKQGDSILSTSSSYNYCIGKGDVSLTGLFRFNPANPANPGANHWDSSTGEAILDDFTPGNLMGTLDALIGGSGNRSKVVKVTVAGTLDPTDLGIARYCSACVALDLKRATSLSSLPDWAFYGAALQSVSLPTSVTSIGSYAFYNCTNLTEINCYSMVPPTLEANVFQGVNENLVFRVPQAAIAQYSAATQWNQFIILPLTEDVGTIGVTLPDSAVDGRYKNLTLELKNVKTAQKMCFVVTDKMKYYFSDLLKGDTYNLYLLNASNVALGETDSITVTKDSVATSFSSLLPLYNLTLKVVTDKEIDVTGQVTVAWYDSNNKFISQGTSLKGLVSGTKVVYLITLNSALGLCYVFPSLKTCMAQNSCQVYTLQPIDSVTVYGYTKKSDGTVLPNVVVAVSQFINGKYAKSVIGSSDNNGYFSFRVLNDVSTITCSLSGYSGLSLSKVNFNTGANLGTLTLSPISGASLFTKLTYTASALPGSASLQESGYSDYQNISYTLYNQTRGVAISHFSVQYPYLVLQDTTHTGDKILVTVSSKVNAFSPVQSVAVLDSAGKSSVELNIVEPGAIKVSYLKSENTSNVAVLYGADGQRIISTVYDDNQSATFSCLSDGLYTIVSLVDNNIFRSILNLSDLSASGLSEGKDYIKSSVKVQRGVIDTLSIPVIPSVDLSQFSYIGSNAYIRVNKATVVAGNYLTLSAMADFKPLYADKVSQVKLIIELPNNCNFVNNSVMTGKSMGGYTVDGSQITIPLNSITDQVKFCVIPTSGGTISPNAFAEFTYNGMVMKQPIGAATCVVKNLDITVPATVARIQLPVSGIAPASSSVHVFDNNVMIGQTTSFANGTWTLQAQLYNAYNLSNHVIYALISTPQNLQVKTASKTVCYDQNAIEVQTVTMINTAHASSSLDLCDYSEVFDFQNTKAQMPAYWYWPNYPDFTFKIDFTNNSPSNISDVTLYVTTSAGTIVPVVATYDAKKDLWIATKKFYTDALPTNLSVDYKAVNQIVFDSGCLKNCFSILKDIQNSDSVDSEKLKNLQTAIKIIEESNTPDYKKLDSLENGVRALIGLSADSLGIGKELTDDEFNSLLANCQTLMVGADTLLFSKIQLASLFYIDDSFLPADLQNKIIATSCDTINESNLVSEGYIQVPTTNGKYVYIKSTESRYIFIDFSDNICLTINSADAKKVMARISSSFGIDQVEAYIEKINAFKEKFSEISENVNNIKEKINDQFDKEISALKAQYLVASCAKNYLINLKQIDKITSAQQKRLNQLEDLCEELEKAGKGLKKCTQLVDEFAGKFSDALEVVDDVSSYLSDLRRYINLYGMVPDPCLNDQDRSNAIKTSIVIAGVSAGLYYLGVVSGDVESLIALPECLAAAPETEGLSLSGAILALAKLTTSDWSKKLYVKVTNIFVQNTEKSISELACSSPSPIPDPGNSGNGGGTTGQSGSGDVTHVLDPSGYVYEGVTSNRLEGVTTSIYQKTYEEDIYGDKHEKITLWDATQYAQENPLTTDINGLYSWDVPEGLWQVKYEKDGYQTSYSDWLPVPPPQLDINVGLVQNTPPYVIKVLGFESGIEILFSKYMQPATTTTDQILVTCDGMAVTGTVSLLNAEADPQESNQQFVSRVRFVPDKPFISSDQVTLTVSRRVKSYAGIMMESDYTQNISIEKELKSIKVDSCVKVVYGKSAQITVSVEPQEASANKKIIAKSASPSIITVSSDTVLDSQGKATFTITGELLGTTALQFSIPETTLSSEVSATVISPEDEEITRKYSLSKGWNWFSVNVADADLNTLDSLLKPIQTSVVSLKGQEGALFLSDTGTWQGSLSNLKSEKSYKIETNKDIDWELTGKAITLQNKAITLYQGWNWIGYLPSSNISVPVALKNLSAEKDEIIKGIDAFAIYNGISWVGSLKQLTPNEGYMYYSHSLKSYNYPDTTTVDSGQNTATHFTYNARVCEDNTIALAQLYQDHQLVDTARYLLGAFVNGECRGISTDVNGILFLTIHADSLAGPISLYAYDMVQGMEYNIQESLSYSSLLNGSLDSPLTLHLGDLTGIGNPISAGSLIVYPSPVRNRLYLYGDLAAVKEWSISDTSGKICLRSSEPPVDGVNVSDLSSAVYIINLRTSSGMKQQKFIKIK